MDLTVKTTAGNGSWREGGRGCHCLPGHSLRGPAHLGFFGSGRLHGRRRGTAPADPRTRRRRRATGNAPGVFGEIFDPIDPHRPDCLTSTYGLPTRGRRGSAGSRLDPWRGFVVGSGSDSLYDGATFARDGVVTVTINYRLGAAGLHHVRRRVPGRGSSGSSTRSPPSSGCRRTSRSFGGDPNRVTICGESAGAMCVGTLLGAPGACGLFRAPSCKAAPATTRCPRASAGSSPRSLRPYSKWT